jgi:hypothetical protein
MRTRLMPMSERVLGKKKGPAISNPRVKILMVAAVCAPSLFRLVVVPITLETRTSGL